ncbi:MAG: hypothetical protein M1814_003208 [Vezdaea aestivalis]|nr:MAG: hypothetical protein M1814_003208 [Vezdaea aestivalis]
MSGFNKFLPRRDKPTSSGHDNTNSRASSAVDLYDMGRGKENKKSEKDEEAKKIKSIQTKLAQIGIKHMKHSQLAQALRADFAKGDPEKAFQLLILTEDSFQGIVLEYDPSVKLLGAVNRKGVTCYLDALLFAMFVRLGSFEAMLYTKHEDLPRKQLGSNLRLWVNMLRSGKLIEVDQTRHLQNALVACGWLEAGTLRQQDASEAFTFITEVLDLPLLTLKMDIYHTGKVEDADDHKFVNERLLEVGIPEDPTGKGILLEDCLETYFNNRIEVRRHLERRATMDSMSSPKGSSFSEKSAMVHVENLDMESRASTPETNIAQSPVPISPATSRHRAPSIIRDIFRPPVGERDDASSIATIAMPLSNQYRPLSKTSSRKEVLMPAWQFFSLIPWYTESAPTRDLQVASHFSSKRPVLGLCLKRYSVLPSGRAVRLETYVDIPLEIGLPHFIQDDHMTEDGPAMGNFKLSLQSVVCHRGKSVNEGHYIALVRDQSSTSTSSASSSADKWLYFNDLTSPRVQHVNIHHALRTETPYLLFYQVQPLDDKSDTEVGNSLPAGPLRNKAPSDISAAALPLTPSVPSSIASSTQTVARPSQEEGRLGPVLPSNPPTSAGELAPADAGSDSKKTGPVVNIAPVSAKDDDESEREGPRAKLKKERGKSRGRSHGRGERESSGAERECVVM